MFSSSYTIPRSLPFVEGLDNLFIPESFAGGGDPVISNRITVPETQFAMIHVPSPEGVYPLTRGPLGGATIPQMEIEFYFAPRIFAIPPRTQILVKADKVAPEWLSGGRGRVYSGRGDCEIFYPGREGTTLNLFLWNFELTSGPTRFETETVNLAAGFSLFITYHSISDFIDD